MIIPIDSNVQRLPTNFLRRINLYWISRLQAANLPNQIRSLQLVTQSLSFLQDRPSLFEDSTIPLSENDGNNVVIANTLVTHFFEISVRFVQFIGLFLVDLIRAEDGPWLKFVNANPNSNKEKRSRRFILKELGTKSTFFKRLVTYRLGGKSV